MHRRILQSTLLVVLLTGLMLGIPLGLTSWRLVEDLTRGNLTARLEQVVATLDDQSGQPDLGQAAIAVPDDGQLVLTLPGNSPDVIGVDPGPDAIVESLPVGRAGRAELAVPAQSMRQMQVQVTALIGFLVVLSVGVGAVVATLTARRISGPMREVAGRAARLGSGDFRPEPTRHRITELDRVADVLDASAAALAQLVQRERDLVGDVSHQLRTRLTALQLRLDELATHPDEQAAAEATAALEQTEQLAGVLDELLEAAEVARAASAEPVDLTELLADVVRDWNEQATAAGREIRLRAPAGLHAKATAGRLREAIVSLLDNALRHGAGTVTIAARSGGAAKDGHRDGMVVVEVTDAGPGIPDGLAPHVFDRGVSGAASSGVGLALARALVEADGGRLELRSAHPATFALYLRVPRDVVGVADAPRPGAGVVR